VRKTLIAMTAASALVLGFGATAFAAGCDSNCFNHHTNVIVGSSLLNIGGQMNGSHSVSGVLNEQNVTGNGAQGIYSNASPIITF
jgi:hypothetical protein